ncbi:hypothetical protein NA57DRAFT_7988, partial [Rhizodiscina lignyota]
EEIKKLIENIRPDEEADPTKREPTPEAMNDKLYPHQRLALTWMKNMEEGTNKGGILADDMGLGKTIQALALMATRRSEDPRRKTTLIIAPVALLSQWAREITTRLKSGKHSLSVFIHHGPRRKKSFNELKMFDVVLTTFGTLGQELKRLQEWQKKQAADPDAYLPPAQNVLLGDNCKWYRVIIDEAQCIKNRTTKSSMATCEIQSIHRWCMTGTPMMNGLSDLFALVRFLGIKPFNDWDMFNKEFIKPIRGSDMPDLRAASMKKFQVFIKAILLRRTKTSQIDGKPILELPPRIVEQKHAIFSEDEKNFYDGLEKKTQVTINKYLRENTVMRHYSNVLVLLLRLRQACCHPHLIKDYAQAENITDIPEDQRLTLAKKLPPDVVERIVAAGGAFECPICYDGVDNPAIMFPCGHDTCMECFVKITTPEQGIAEGDENGQAKCPQCRVKADRNKVVDYETFQKVHEPEKWAEKHPDAGNSQEDDDDTADETESEDDDDETESLDGFIVDDDMKPKSKKKGSKGKGKAKAAPKLTLAELKKLSLRNKASKRKYLRRLEKDWVTSSKIDKTIEILKEIDENDPEEKTIIFSQWTSMLDLLEVPLHRQGFICQRYDGSMDATLRANAVEEFMTQSRCKVMLVSLKAGNAGLNLTAASQVIILDPFWNPYVEEQAIDRAHRIGQRRDVHVHRVLVADTVEDRIILLQNQKRDLIGAALDENASKDLGRLGVNQIRFLF